MMCRSIQRHAEHFGLELLHDAQPRVHIQTKCIADNIQTWEGEFKPRHLVYPFVAFVGHRELGERDERLAQRSQIKVLGVADLQDKTLDASQIINLRVAPRQSS